MHRLLSQALALLFGFAAVAWVIAATAQEYKEQGKAERRVEKKAAKAEKKSEAKSHGIYEAPARMPGFYPDPCAESPDLPQCRKFR